MSILIIREVVQSKKAFFFDLFHTLTCLEIVPDIGQLTNEFLGITREDWLMHLFSDAEGRLKGSISEPVDIIRDIACKIKDIPEEVLFQAAELRRAQFARCLFHIPVEIQDTISELKKRGKKIVLISNADMIEAAGWKDCPVRHLFDEAVFSCHAGMFKPSLEIYQYAMSQIGARPEESVFVGDGGSGELAGAKAAGMTAIMTTEFTSRFRAGQIERYRHEADYIVTALNDLIC